MSDPLLPTPRAQDEYERSNRKTVAKAMDGEAQMTLTRMVRGMTDPKIAALRTSASSPGSEDSTLPSSGSGSDASDRSSGTRAAPESSNDGGPMFRDGEMFEISTEDRFSLAVRLYNEGWSVGRVAEHFGVTRQSMWKTLRRRTQIRSREEAAFLARKPETVIRRKRAATRDRYRSRTARITRTQMQAIRERDVTCRMCGEQGADFDHILPVALGGQTTMENLQLLCHRCHVEKSRTDRTLAAEAKREGVVWLEASSISSSEASHSHANQSPRQDAGERKVMIDGSGRSSPVAFARFNPDGSTSKTYRDSSVQASLLGTHYEKFSGTWPRSGSMHGGIVYEHPTLERPTVGSASSYLPTATAGDAKSSGNRENPNNRAHDGLSLTDALRPNRHGNMLHTPTATDGSPRYDHRASPGYTRAIPVPNLDAQIAELLPTPTADHSRGLAQTSTDYQSLPNEIVGLLPTPNAGTTPNGHGRRGGRKGNGHQSGSDLEASLGDLTNQPSEDGSE